MAFPFYKLARIYITLSLDITLDFIDGMEKIFLALQITFSNPLYGLQSPMDFILIRILLSISWKFTFQPQHYWYLRGILCEENGINSVLSGNFLSFICW